jgi:OOP family OmpA-OmpF porin
MKMQLFRLVSTATITIGLVSAAGQVAAADSGGYVGFSAGQSKTNLDGNEIDASLASIGLGSSTSVDDSDFGFKLYGGYQFNKNFALEAGYTDLGELKSHTVITSGSSGTLDGKWKAYSIDISAVGILPVNEKFSLFGRAGVSFWNLDFDLTGNGPGGSGTLSESESGVGPLLAFGASFDIARQFILRAEYERHFDLGKDDTTGKGDVDLLSIGLVYRF